MPDQQKWIDATTVKPTGPQTIPQGGQVANPDVLDPVFAQDKPEWLDAKSVSTTPQTNPFWKKLATAMVTGGASVPVQMIGPMVGQQRAVKGMEDMALPAMLNIGTALATGGESIPFQMGAQGLMGGAVGGAETGTWKGAAEGAGLGALTGGIGAGTGRMMGNAARLAKPNWAKVNGQWVKTEGPAAGIAAKLLPFDVMKNVGAGGALVGGTEATANNAIRGVARTGQAVAPAIPGLTDALRELIFGRQQR